MCSVWLLERVREWEWESEKRERVFCTRKSHTARVLTKIAQHWKVTKCVWVGLSNEEFDVWKTECPKWFVPFKTPILNNLTDLVGVLRNTPTQTNCSVRVHKLHPVHLFENSPSQSFILTFVVYYESIKRKLKIRCVWVSVWWKTTN